MLSSPSHREQQLRWPPLPLLTRGHTLLGIEMEKSCSECSEQRGAQSLCTFCNKWLCYQCTDMHQHQKATATNTSTTTTINTSSTQYADLHQLARPTSTQCPDMHQRGNGSLTTIEPGPGLHPRSVLTCHSHRQEPLELFCESCDLLCCNSCHLSTHKNHRLVHIGKALQDQQWLFESLVAQVDERRSAVENTAKQIEDRLHGIKIMHRKAENQIKMAKMIMMNELNKRAHLLIEQLEKITEDFQRNLEDQLQGAIETCGQLDHVQRFITWATTQHGRSPVLFSRELISLQMQQLFESSFHQDAWVPVKIKFNWDASYWTKQISTLGELDVEGGDCSYPEGLACPDILRPTPMGCLALPSVCHRGADQGCGYQACCHPQICCMHCIPSKSDMANLDQSQLEAVPYSSSCAQHALLQSQQIQRCCGPASPPLMHSSLQCPTPPQATSPTQLGSSHGSMSQSRPATPQPQLKSHHRQCQQYSDCQAQLTVDSDRPGQVQGQCQGKPLACKTSQAQRLDQTAAGREITTEETWEPRWRGEQSLGHTPLVESRDAVGRGSQQGRREYISLEQQQMFYISPAAELRREQQGNRLSLPQTDYRNRRARSTSLEVSAHDVQSGSSSVCGRRKNRSQSIPAELAAPSTSPPANDTYSLDQYGVMDARQRRASDGVIQCAARETSTAVPPLRVQSTMYLHPPLLTYKTESDNAYGFTNEEVTKEKYRAQRNSPKNREVPKEAGSPRVPMVCLERLKVLVSRLPPHGRRQSDPLPASGLQHRTWRDGMAEGTADGSDTMRTILSHITPPYTSEQRSPRQSTTPPVIHELHSHGKGSSLKDLAQPAAATDPKHEPQRYSAAPDLDSDSDPGSGSEELELFSEPDLDSEPQLESDTPPESDQHPETSSEAEGESMTKAESVAAREMGLCGKTDILRLSEPGAEYEPDPESDTGMGSDNGEEQDADVESGDAEAESDIQPDSEPSLEADSDILSDQAADSQGSVGSEPEIESEPELTTDEPQPLRSTTTGTDDPQPLRCDQQEGPPIGPGQRPLLIANSCPPGGCDRSADARPDQGNTEMESEDYCAVCLIGGDLLCCDRCPKVFHLSCHIPPLRCFPTGDWICTLCRDVVRPEMEYDCENERTSGHHASSSRGLSTCDQRKCERLTLLIFSNILSAPFHEPVSPLARHYYQIIKRPMDLSVIRAKLNKRNTRHYYSTEEFVTDVYLMFRNCAKFNYPDSEVAQAGHSLEAFFNSKLKEVFPDKVFPMAEEEPDSDEYDEAYRATENGFPWPAGTEQCHRKRKRRHSVNSKRHQV